MLQNHNTTRIKLILFPKLGIGIFGKDIGRGARFALLIFHLAFHGMQAWHPKLIIVIWRIENHLIKVVLKIGFTQLGVQGFECFLGTLG